MVKFEKSERPAFNSASFFSKMLSIYLIFKITKMPTFFTIVYNMIRYSLGLAYNNHIKNFKKCLQIVNSKTTYFLNKSTEVQIEGGGGLAGYCQTFFSKFPISLLSFIFFSLFYLFKIK